jgi:hypothetical protein
MKKNMGVIDRVIRTLLAITIGALWYWDILPEKEVTLLIIVAIIFLLTSISGFCPLYRIFGFRTCKADGKEQSLIDQQN